MIDKAARENLRELLSFATPHERWSDNEELISDDESGELIAEFYAEGGPKDANAQLARESVGAVEGLLDELARSESMLRIARGTDWAASLGACLRGLRGRQDMKMILDLNLPWRLTLIHNLAAAGALCEFWRHGAYSWGGHLDDWWPGCGRPTRPRNLCA